MLRQESADPGLHIRQSRRCDAAVTNDLNISVTYRCHFISGFPWISIIDLALAVHSDSQTEEQPIRGTAGILRKGRERCRIRRFCSEVSCITSLSLPFHWSKQVLETLLVCPSFCGKVFNSKLNVTVENEMDGYVRFPQGEPGPCRQPVQTCQPVWLPTVLPNVTSHAECRILHQCIAYLWRSLGKNTKKLRLRELKSLNKSHTANR